MFGKRVVFVDRAVYVPQTDFLTLYLAFVVGFMVCYLYVGRASE